MICLVTDNQVILRPKKHNNDKKALHKHGHISNML